MIRREHEDYSSTEDVYDNIEGSFELKKRVGFPEYYMNLSPEQKEFVDILIGEKPSLLQKVVELGYRLLDKEDELEEHKNRLHQEGIYDI